MTKARRELAALMPSQDVVIEVLDARLPRASSNPVITELRGAKPAIKVLTKSDLADPEVTRAWIEHFSAEPGVTAFASTTDKPNVTRKRIAELTRGRMAVLISHRFSTVRMADRILVLADGSIREQGSHEQLLSLGGRYAELFELQAAGYR